MGGEDAPITVDFLAELTGSNIFATGVFALEKGWMMTSLLVTAIAVACIDGNFRALMIWLSGAALFAFLGISHKFEVLANDVVSRLGPAWEWVASYLLAIAAIVAVHFWMREPDQSRESASSPEEQNSLQ
jgi:hypothetical protein